MPLMTRRSSTRALGRSLGELLDVVETLMKKGVALLSLEEKIDTSSAASELVFHVFGAIAQFECRLIAARTRDGMRARSDGAEIAPYRPRPGLLSRRAKPITARATGLRLNPYCNASLMQFALSAVIFGTRRGRRASVARASRDFDGLRRVEKKGNA